MAEQQEPDDWAKDAVLTDEQVNMILDDFDEKRKPRLPGELPRSTKPLPSFGELPSGTDR